MIFLSEVGRTSLTMRKTTPLADLPSADIFVETVSDLPKIVTAKEAARFLRYSDRTLAREIAAGRLQPMKRSRRGSRVLILRSEIANYLRALRAAA